MSSERRSEATRSGDSGDDGGGAGAPGKRSLSERLPVQRRGGVATEAAAAAPAGTTGVVEDPFALHLEGARGGSMEPAVQAKMERSFGTSFADVRVHEGPQAAAMGAAAYTQGTDVHFAPGQYAPDRAEGQELLGHELAHVVQQRQGRVSPDARSGKDAPINSDPALEAEADAAGARAARGEAAHVGSAGAPVAAVQRRALAVPVTAVGASSGALARDMAAVVGGSFEGGPAGGEAVVQAKVLDGKRLLAAVRGLDFFKDKLDNVKLAQGPSLEEHIERVIKNYETHFARKKDEVTNEGMKLAALLTAVAREVARALGDPSLQSKLAVALADTYGSEIASASAAKKHGFFDGKKADQGHQDVSESALALATTLVSDDPVMLFLTEKCTVEAAAWRIRKMATAAKLEPAAMFTLLSEQFQMDMGAHTDTGVKQGAKKKDQIEDDEGKKGDGEFELKDLYGEIEPSFYAGLRPLTNKVPEKLPWKKKGGLDLNGKVQKRLDNLHDKVVDKDLPSLEVSDDDLDKERKLSGDTLSKGQTSHFARLRQEEEKEKQTTEKGKTPEEVVVAKLMDRYQASKEKIEQAIVLVVDGLKTVPLTITSKLENLFKERDDKQALPHYGSKYMSEQVLAQKEHNLQDAIGDKDHTVDGKVTALGHKGGGYVKGRGENYMRWRREKDERETGFHELSAEDLPIFGAINPNFATTLGGNANLAKGDDKGNYDNATAFGKNYYGDVHMLLKDSVRPRSTFIARGKKFVEGKRIERLDFALLLYDMVRLSMYDFVDALMLQAIGSDKVVLTNMDAEVHIYGGLDVATDVAEIYLQPEHHVATDGAPQRAKDFAKTAGITVKDIGTVPKGFEVHGKMALAAGKKDEVKGGLDMQSEVKKFDPK